MRLLIRSLITLALVFAAANSGWAVDLGTLITTENALFPIFCLDDSGHVRFDIDSFIVEVTKHDGGETSGDLVVDYSARGDTTAAWVTRSVYASDTNWWFRDAVADIDGDAGNGQYTGVVKAYKLAHPTVTPFSFYLTTTSFTTLIERLDAAMTTRLAPTTAGRTLDVTATGEAGIDLDNTTGTISTSEFAAETDIVSGGAITTSGGAVSTVTTVTNSLGTSIAASEVDDDVSTEFYNKFISGSNEDQFKANVSGLATQTSVDDIPTVAEFEARTLVAANYFDPAADGVNATSISGSSPAADSAEAFFLRATKAVAAVISDTPTVNIGKVDDDTVPANNLRLAFDLAMDSSVRLDLGQLRIAMPNNTASPYFGLEPAFAAWNHGAGVAGNFASDSSTGVRIDGGNGSADHGLHIRSGTGTGSSNGLMIQARSTGGSDAIYLSVATGQTSSSKIIDMVGNNSAGNVTGIYMSGVGGAVDVQEGNVLLAGGLSIGGTLSANEIQLNNTLGMADFGDDFEDMISDSIRKPLGDTLTAFIQEVLDTFGTQGWAATGASACAGSGIVTCTLDVRNAAGPLGNVKVTVNNTGDVELLSAISDPSTGLCIFNVDDNTAYHIKALPPPGSTHDSIPYQMLVTTAATNIRDTIPITTTVIGSAASPQMARVYGHIKYADDTPVQNATIKIVPDQSGTAVAGGSTTLLPEPLYSAPSDANGLAYVDVWWSSQVVYPSTDLTYKYNIYVLAPNDAADGAIKENLVRKRVTIPDSTNYNLVLYLQ